MKTARESQRKARDLPSEQIAAAENRATPLAMIGLALIACVIGASYHTILAHLIYRWGHESDYSHGFLVPVFSGWLLWQRRSILKTIRNPVRGRWCGVILLVLSGLLQISAVYFNYVLLEPIALIMCIAGAFALVGGFPAFHWAWPAIMFLFFMVPLPGVLAGRMSGPLQHVATVCSTYVLQTIGIPAIATGNVIWLTNGKIGVVEACSGLRMLMMFGAVTVATVFLLRITNWEKVCLLVSSGAIAIAANVFRISATGMAHELISAEFADKIFHDFAGWIMMPLAMFMLGLEVVLLAKLFPPISASPRTDIRTAGRVATPVRAR